MKSPLLKPRVRSMEAPLLMVNGGRDAYSGVYKVFPTFFIWVSMHRRPDSNLAERETHITTRSPSETLHRPQPTLWI